MAMFNFHSCLWMRRLHGMGSYKKWSQKWSIDIYRYHTSSSWIIVIGSTIRYLRYQYTNGSKSMVVTHNSYGYGSGAMKYVEIPWILLGWTSTYQLLGCFPGYWWCFDPYLAEFLVLLLASLSIQRGFWTTLLSKSHWCASRSKHGSG